MTSGYKLTLLLLLGGGIIVTYGLVISFADVKLTPDPPKTYDKNKLCQYEEIRCVDYGAVGIPFHFNDGSNGTIDSRIQLRTFDVWAVDNQINYTISIIVAHQSVVDHMGFIILQSEENATVVRKDMGKYIDIYKSTGGFIELDVEKPNVFLKDYNINFTTEQQIVLIPVIQKGNFAYSFPETQPLISIGSHLQKLQAQTNRELLKSIAESEITNDRIIGLTIVGIGLVPLGIALQALIDRKRNP